jgi:hypothetical protein
VAILASMLGSNKYHKTCQLVFIEVFWLDSSQNGDLHWNAKNSHTFPTHFEHILQQQA